MKPQIDWIPARPLSASPHTVDLLVRITPPTPPQDTPPPPLDLALVLDTSGSMRGQPLDLAKAAALEVHRHLRPADRLALVTFASSAQLVAPLQPAIRADGFGGRLAGLEAGGSTALAQGWGLAADVLRHPDASQPPLAPNRLKRTLLLTDGRANVGPRDPRLLGAGVGRALSEGISTSTVGVGTHYDERLLEELAGAGDGNYHYAETPTALEGLFLSELESLGATVGRRVSLGVRGVEVLDVLNDLPRLPNGRLALPPLRAQKPLEVLLRVRAKAGDRLTLRLAWTDAAGERQVERPDLVFGAGEPQAEHPEVVRLRGALQVARVQRQMAELTDRGNVAQALVRLGEARGRLEALATQGVDVAGDLAQLGTLQAWLTRGERGAASKAARSFAYRKSTGRE
ncbi:VWA domain-containing protein [Deinococcus sp. MIMF12]|uniref:VWA domain-containing protein n=1 Tax=Deinococcus rhizophilus TaxID=3049544 RepID=A0ABT7JDZ3_9DEIO|nr:VWA domain-containing protein [Deinococcus rhizophilus]MDL2342693.1 VWA domain-containing protein [Deinococcus rhizophilus]